MKTPQPNRRIPGDDYPSPGECSLLNSMNRHTVTHPSQSTSPRAAKPNRRSLLIAAIVLGVAAAAPLHAANPDSAGQTAAAILDYERAQWLAPHATTIANQLASVRAQAGLATPERSTLSRATHALSFDALTAFASISLLMFALLVFGTRLIPASLRASSRKAAAGFGAIALLCASGVAGRWPELHRAVIIAANPAVHLAPADSSSASFALKPGDVVRTGKAYGPFVRVISPDGQSGWIRETSVESIL